MIGHLSGEVVFSDGSEVIVMTNSGIGYQIYAHKVFPEASWISLFISHVIRENSEELYGFETLRAKKLFEMLLTVKSVGAKSAFSLISSLGIEAIIDAVLTENKGVLKKAPGVGDKAASQMILDLSKKIMKVKMYEHKKRVLSPVSRSSAPAEEKVWESENLDMFEGHESLESDSSEEFGDLSHKGEMIQEALMACRELGFKEEAVLPKAQKILAQTPVTRSEQLVHLVLKEM